jgi:hypothetical protein
MPVMNWTSYLTKLAVGDGYMHTLTQDKSKDVMNCNNFLL